MPLGQPGGEQVLQHRPQLEVVPAAGGGRVPEQAALAAELLGADRLLPIHYGGYALPELYEPVPDALERLNATTDRLTAVHVGATVDV